MKKEYKFSCGVVFLHFLIYMIAGFIVGVLVFQVTKMFNTSVVLGVLFFIIFLVSSFINSIWRVDVIDDLIVFRETKIKKEYDLKKSKISIRVSFLNYILIIVDSDDETHYYDCSFLGKKQFVELLNKLKINKGV